MISLHQFLTTHILTSGFGSHDPANYGCFVPYGHEDSYNRKISEYRRTTVIISLLLILLTRLEHVSYK